MSRATRRSSSGTRGGSRSACSAFTTVVDERPVRTRGHVSRGPPARDAADGRRLAGHRPGRATVTYGLLVLATISAAGVLAWRLALAMGLGPAGSWVAGILWASSPIVLYRAASGLYMLLLLAALLPAALILARRLVHDFSHRSAIGLGSSSAPVSYRPPSHGVPPARRRSGRGLRSLEQPNLALESSSHADRLGRRQRPDRRLAGDPDDDSG